MNPDESVQITRLLGAWAEGDAVALERLIPMVHGELRRIARRHMRDHADGNTLQPTALVNEAYLRLADITQIRWQNRAHFFAVAANIMRRILIDAARARYTDKRGGGFARIQLKDSLDGLPDKGHELIALDEALGALEKLDPRKARVVELKFFGGLSVEETAEVLKISPRSVMRDWNMARAWLIRELGA